MANLLECESSQALFPRTQLMKGYWVGTKIGSSQTSPKLWFSGPRLERSGGTCPQLASPLIPRSQDASVIPGRTPSPAYTQQKTWFRDSPSVPRNTKLPFHSGLLGGLWVEAIGLSHWAPAMSRWSKNHLSPTETVTASDLCFETILKSVVF